jgi:hypothetical protein
MPYEIFANISEPHNILNPSKYNILKAFERMFIRKYNCYKIYSSNRTDAYYVNSFWFKSHSESYLLCIELLNEYQIRYSAISHYDLGTEIKIIDTDIMASQIAYDLLYINN